MDNLCRVCIKSPENCTTLSSKIEDSSNLSFLDFLNKCTSLNAGEGDSLPQTLCAVCANSMKTFYVFVKLAENSDIALRHMKNLIEKGETSREEITIKREEIEEESEEFNQGDSFHCQSNRNSTEPILYTLDIVKEEPQLSESTSIVVVKDAEVNESEKFESNLDHPKRSIEEPDDVLSRTDRCLASVDTQHIDFEDDIPISLLKKRLDKNGDEADSESNRGEIYGKRISSKRYLNLHRECHKRIPHTCDQCGKKFKNESSLKYHIIWHANQTAFECENCGKVLSFKCQFDSHMEICNQRKGIKCHICGKTVCSKQYFNFHIDSHNGITHKCDQCHKIFENIVTLRQHMKTHATRKLFYCEYCGKCYSGKSWCCGFLIKTHNVTQ